MSSVVLLVEDHDDTRAMCALALQLAGFAVVEAASGDAALAVLEHETPDIIVTDLAMPGMDGVEMCRRIRLLPNGKRIPILALTGHAHSPAFADVAGAGACAACSKPLAPDALSALVQTLLEEGIECKGCWESGERFTSHRFAAGVTWWRRPGRPTGVGQASGLSSPGTEPFPHLKPSCLRAPASE